MDSSTIRNLALIVLSVVLSSAGQTALKMGLDRLTPAQRAQAVEAVWWGMRQPLALLGIGLFAASVLVWVAVLADADLSWGYPLLGLSYVVVALSGWLILGETLGAWRLAGIALILAGAALIAGS